MSSRPFSRDVLRIDPPAECERIVQAMRRMLREPLRRRGFVLGLSGGIDSSVCAALAVRAVGAERVMGLLLPERETSRETRELGALLAHHLGVEAVIEDLTGMLEGAGCYRRREAAIKRLVPAYGPGWRSKIALPPVDAGPRWNVFSLVVEGPDGATQRHRMPLDVYQELVAGTNMKQRARKLVEYFHAERLGYAVIGTPNRLEYDQGFFVKGGDGAADLKPIAHLYKTQVYALAEHLDVPEVIRLRPPTTDTYSMVQTQEEFYFALSHDRMDLCLYGHNHAVPAAEVARELEMGREVIEAVYRDIESKRRTTRYLHLPPLLVEPVAEVAGERHRATEGL